MPMAILAWSRAPKSLLQDPIIPPIRVAVTMSRKEAVPILPKPRPNPLPICLRDMQFGQGRLGEKLKSPLTHRRWQSLQLRLQLEEKHQPVRLALKPMLTHHPRQMKIRCRKLQPQFLMRFPGRTSIGRLPLVRVKLSTAWTPEPAIRFLRSLQQQNLVLLVEAIKQRSNFVRQLHPGSEAIEPQASKQISKTKSPHQTVRAPR